jgi:hypothetical protein
VQHSCAHVRTPADACAVRRVASVVICQLARGFRAIIDGGSPSAIADEDVREILTTGTTYLYRVADPALGLQQLIITIVEEMRHELELRRATAPPP